MDETIIRLFNTNNPTNTLDPDPNKVLLGTPKLAEGKWYGHYGPENAVAVSNYPYGRRLRCIMRYWLEFKKGKGTRLVSQTNNPKRPGLVWNKPHAGTYTDGVVVLYTNDEGHVKAATFNDYSLWSCKPETADALDAFERRYADAFTESDRDYMVRYRNYVSQRLIDTYFKKV